MGEYSELFFRANLNHKFNTEDLLVLENLLGTHKDKTIIYPNHKFFNCERFLYALNGASSYHTTGKSYIDINKNVVKLFIHSSLKNYDNEFEKFIDWIEPYLQTHGLLGWILSPNEYNPRLIYRKENI